ncbi:MAG TPA: hypothetical protein VHV79_11035 [Mycobacteriales bacterium]|jgi:hypothetical protein|nr:hypothetical protein [Mycobacteriales bacterium]
MMTRRCFEVAVAVGLLAALSVGTGEAIAMTALPAASSHAVPVLGSKKFDTMPDAVGYGTAHPKRIFNGGDPSGDAYHLRWASWGAAASLGHGKTYVFKPSGGYYKRPGRIELKATRLGHCTAHGPLAYRHLHARVAGPGKSYGHWFRWSEVKNICHSHF